MPSFKSKAARRCARWVILFLLISTSLLVPATSYSSHKKAIMSQKVKNMKPGTASMRKSMFRFWRVLGVKDNELIFTQGRPGMGHQVDGCLAPHGGGPKQIS
ncbi:hypothetical protein QJS10_CPB15g01801 [Acorus calamus]|uniref:Uncharacterized protein n=1 Tax=Acorus calamus TaxID=4465 RepID=A0AAV9D757_ACOCL|nr:hypothetical protein QJS10_CPB15g01801 [Acorus calamus]